MKFGERLPLISGGVAAALAGVMLVVLFGMYLLPFGTMRHGSSVPVDVPTIRAGAAYFDKPPSIVITLRADHSIYIGPSVVRHSQLQTALKDVRAKHPNQMVELRAFKSATLGDLAPVLSAIRGPDTRGSGSSASRVPSSNSFLEPAPNSTLQPTPTRAA